MVGNTPTVQVVHSNDYGGHYVLAHNLHGHKNEVVVIDSVTRPRTGEVSQEVDDQVQGLFGSPMLAE